MKDYAYAYLETKIELESFIKSLKNTDYRTKTSPVEDALRFMDYMNREIERLKQERNKVRVQFEAPLLAKLTAAREREEKALALLKETRKWMDPIMGEWDANFIRQFDFAIAAFDASRAADGKEGA